MSINSAFGWGLVILGAQLRNHLEMYIQEPDILIIADRNCFHTHYARKLNIVPGSVCIKILKCWSG